MRLEELLAPQPGQLLKGFEKIRIDYVDGIKTNVSSPCFIGWNLDETKVKQTIGITLYKKFPCEDELIITNRRKNNSEECCKILLDNSIQEKNYDLLQENKLNNFNIQIIKFSSEDTIGMFLGDYFSTIGDSAIPTPDNFKAHLYAKILCGDTIGWIRMNILGSDCFLEVE